MSKLEVVERILSDAKAEAKAVVAAAEEKAEALKKQSAEKVAALREETEQEAEAYRVSLHEKRAAAARLAGAKLLLREKRKTLDELYKAVLQELLHLDKESCLALTKTLLERYAEEGDELLFAENFPFADAVKLLPVYKEKKLTMAKEKRPLDGGFMLIGKTADKDLSYGALLSADRERNEAALAAKIFI